MCHGSADGDVENYPQQRFQLQLRPNSLNSRIVEYGAHPEFISNLRPEKWRWLSDDTISSKEATVCGGFVAFHTDISNGTIAVRGDRPLTADVIAFWKIEIAQPLFGTSIMFGIGSSQAKRSLRYCFANLLGLDDQSYGLSYNGQIFHNGIGVQFCEPFHNPCSLSILFHGPSASIGFFRNETFLGWAFTQIDLAKPLYPMISSTAQRSYFNVRSQWSRSVLPESLSEKCLEQISALISEATDVQRLPIPEFLKRSLTERIGRPRLNLQVSLG